MLKNIRNFIISFYIVKFAFGAAEPGLSDVKQSFPSVCYNEDCCNENQFHCGNGNCIPIDKVCESDTNTTDRYPLFWEKNHCGDLSDILSCSTVPCASRNKCDQMCLDLPGNKSRCTCYKGYEITFFNNIYSCSDINECSIGNHICSHDCKNLNGTFACTCRNGFGKDVQEREAACKAEDEEVLIFYNSQSFIVAFNVKERTKKVVVWSGNVDEMSYDPTTDIIYWSNENRVARSYLPGAKNGSVSVAHAQILGTFLKSDNTVRNSLTVDWVGGNIFWLSSDVLENNITQIMVSKLDGRYIKTLLDVPYGNSLALDPEGGMMYWSSGGPDPKIYIGLMSGEIQWIFKKVPGQNPTALTVDYLSNRIYWVDSNSRTIYLIFKSGSGLRKVFTTSEQHLPKAMDIFENNIYWVTEFSNELVRRDKFGKGATEVLVSNLVNQTTIKVYHKLKYFFETNTKLSENNKCSHLYIYSKLPFFNNCHCPDGSKGSIFQAEYVCSSEQVKAADDPIVCDCKEKDKVCNSSTVYRFCACGNICLDGLQVPDYNDFPEIPAESATVPVEYLVIIIIFFVIVIFCFVLSFYKKVR